MADEHFNKQERKHLAMLRRRLLHLSRRVENHQGRNASFDHAEGAALRWALKEIERARREIT